MKELLKNFVASTPLAAALLVGYTTKPIIFVAKQLTNLGVFLHEKLETKLGKEITQKKAEIKKAVEMMTALKQRMEAAQASGEHSDDILANIVKNGGKQEENLGNVFVLGKKDDGNKT